MVSPFPGERMGVLSFMCSLQADPLFQKWDSGFCGDK